VKSNLSHVVIALLGLSFAAGCGLESSLVGGRCRDGMVLSGDTCVTTPPSVTLITPTDPPMGSFGNSAAGNSPPSPPSTVDPPSEQPIIDFTPPDSIVPPDVITPSELSCAAPLVACRGKCISVVSDGMNCGACGKICPSNICVDGECLGAMPGDVVLIGHDYSNALSYSAQAKVLANAIGIPTTDPIRVLSYEEGASPQAVSMAKEIASDTVFGRKIEFTTAGSASDLASATLGRSYDVVLIHDAGAGDAALIGASWATSLQGFTIKGGVVIALDSGSSPMPTLLSSAGLLTVGGHTKMPVGTHLLVTSAADVVGAQVLSPYAAFGAAVSFQGLAAQSVDLSWVIRAKNLDATPGDAIVVHRIVR